MLALALLLAAAQPPAAPSAAAPPVITTLSGLRLQTLRAGTGRRPEPADAVLLSYVGKLADGTVFDKAEEPVGLPVSGTVAGFEEALLLMNKGGTYRIWLPPHLAYGPEGAGGVIPPNATLEFTLTLHDIGRPAPGPAPE